MNKLSLLLAVMVALAITSCKKNHDPQDQSCPVNNALPDKVDHTYPSGVTLTSQYSYDALNRVTQITNLDSTYPQSITYRGTDTVIFHDFEYQDSLNIVAQRVFNSFGDHLASAIYYIRQNGDTLYFFDYTYSYDASRQLKQSILYVTTHVGSSTVRELSDSSNYLWGNGNLYQKISNFPSLSTTFEYLPNTNGSFIFNVPSNNSFYTLNTLFKGVLSTNLVSKSTDGNGTVINYTYTFDASGRVKTVSYNGHTYTFHWKCI